ncbi:MAG: hypothetical protein ACKESB_02135 [Candidatus Hodgkinia cicadicola]
MGAIELQHLHNGHFISRLLSLKVVFLTKMGITVFHLSLLRIKLRR